MGGECSTNVEKRNVSRICGEKPESRPRRRSIDGVKMDRRERGWDGVDLDLYGIG
jgi:hypothetical protein